MIVDGTYFWLMQEGVPTYVLDGGRRHGIYTETGWLDQDWSRLHCRVGLKQLFLSQVYLPLLLLSTEIILRIVCSAECMYILRGAQPFTNKYIYKRPSTLIIRHNNPCWWSLGIDPMLFSKLHSEQASGNKVKHVSDTTSIDESLQNTTNRHETSPLRSASLPNHPSLHQTRLLQKKPQKNSLTSALHPSHTPDTLFRKNSSHPQKPNFELGKNRSSTTVHTRQHATMEKEAEGIKSNAWMEQMDECMIGGWWIGGLFSKRRARADSRVA